MDLIKKSASVTENDYKRVTILFFKEIKVLQYWYAYTATEIYESHVKYYLQHEYSKRTPVWYDRTSCMKILGMCDFGSYLKGKDTGGIIDVYNLYAAFLGIFWEDEYYKWAIEFGEKKLPSEQANWVRCFSERNAELIDNWIKLKNALG